MLIIKQNDIIYIQPNFTSPQLISIKPFENNLGANIITLIATKANKPLQFYICSA